MNNSMTYSWQGAYQCAVLETDPAQMAQRIDDALRAIERRVGSTVRIDNTENEAIEFTRNALAVLRGEWFGGLSESMNGVVPQKELKLNLLEIRKVRQNCLAGSPTSILPKRNSRNT